MPSIGLRHGRLERYTRTNGEHVPAAIKDHSERPDDLEYVKGTSPSGWCHSPSVALFQGTSCMLRLTVAIVVGVVCCA